MTVPAKARYEVIRGGGDRRVIDDQGELDLESTAIPSDEAILLDRLKKTGRELAAAKAENSRLCKVDPQAGVILTILEHWREATKHPKAQIPVDGSRAKVVKRMLGMYEPEQLFAAIDNVAAKPWMGQFGERFCCPGPGRKRRDELELILRDERHVEEALALRADEEHLAYRRWLRDLLAEHPKLVPALGLLAVREPHGDVLAAAAVWARKQASP